ncbi:MAG: helix-turn-helix domain-containing protein [Paracoccus sp. (in: a-proteobacteria)]
MDQARAILLTLAGWTADRIAQAFGVRQDTVGQWRRNFMACEVETLKMRKAPDPVPVKTKAMLRTTPPLRRRSTRPCIINHEKSRHL